MTTVSNDKTYRIARITGYVLEHRDTHLVSILRHQGDYYIDGMKVIAVTLKGRKGWYIIPADFTHEEALSDIGPFSHADDAFLNLRLRSTEFIDD